MIIIIPTRTGIPTIPGIGVGVFISVITFGILTPIFAQVSVLAMAIRIGPGHIPMDTLIGEWAMVLDIIAGMLIIVVTMTVFGMVTIMQTIPIIITTVMMVQTINMVTGKTNLLM